MTLNTVGRLNGVVTIPDFGFRPLRHPWNGTGRQAGGTGLTGQDGRSTSRCSPAARSSASCCRSAPTAPSTPWSGTAPNCGGDLLQHVDVAVRTQRGVWVTAPRLCRSEDATAGRTGPRPSPAGSAEAIGRREGWRISTRAGSSTSARWCVYGSHVCCRSRAAEPELDRTDCRVGPRRHPQLHIDPGEAVPNGG
jgi:hypothetical protein